MHTEIVVLLRAVNGTSAPEGNTVTLEVVLLGFLEENLTVTYQLSFMNGTANSKLVISGNHIYSFVIHLTKI